MFWKFILLIGYSFTFCLCDRNHQAENDFFTQALIHPVVNEHTARDPKPFEPYPVWVKPDSRTPSFENSCQCGVHDYQGSTSKLRQEGTNESVVIQNEDLKPLIDNGELTDKNQFPFIVALIYRQSDGNATHFCGGTLITNKLILTATHCLHGKTAEKTEVWTNERDFLLSTETDHPTIKTKALRFIPHPEYNPLMNYNDISLIELTQPVDIVKSYLRPICLPPTEFYDPLEHVKTGTTAGWGQTMFNGPKSDHLKHVDVPLITNKECNEESEPYYNGRVTTHMICAGDLVRGGRDACPGDSGGPLFVKHGDRFRLIGIVSWGERCSEPRRPGVYTRVSKYLRWINKVDSEIETSVRCVDNFPNKQTQTYATKSAGD